MKHILLALGLACALAASTPGVPARAQETTLTIQAADGALLLRGSVQHLSAIRDTLQRAADTPRAMAQIIDSIRQQYPDDQVSVLAFHEAGAAGSGMDRVEIPLRRALLRGLLPPVEGLPHDLAFQVLRAAGMRPMVRDAWDALSPGEQLVAAARGSGPLAVMSGFSPRDTALLIYVQTQEAGGETSEEQ